MNFFKRLMTRRPRRPVVSPTAPTSPVVVPTVPSEVYPGTTTYPSASYYTTRMAAAIRRLAGK